MMSPSSIRYHSLVVDRKLDRKPTILSRRHLRDDPAEILTARSSERRSRSSRHFRRDPRPFSRFVFTFVSELEPKMISSTTRHAFLSLVTHCSLIHADQAAIGDLADIPGAKSRIIVARATSSRQICRIKRRQSISIVAINARRRPPSARIESSAFTAIRLLPAARQTSSRSHSRPPPPTSDRAWRSGG